MEPFRLRIIFNGDTPGLPEHRLSVDAFAKPLRNLLLAYRRIVSGMMRDALSPTYGQRGGKYTKEAKAVDLEISQIVEGSAGLVAVCTSRVPADETLPMFKDGLLRRAGELLLESLEVESRGELRNAGVRRFLRSLPPGVRRQSYVLEENGAVIRTADIGELELPEVPVTAPWLDEIEGTVVGVGFEPGPNEVRIKSEGTTLTLFAQPSHVTKALDLRGQPVRAMVLRGATNRLLWLRGEHETTPARAHADAISEISRRWDGVLRRLAE